ncbi:MAG: phosphate/phosphite/phosphonate ABC transporter substrate-binding protein [Magnetococcales bacterium]|nr:phosphate/phosphite/phosphonate ABC transporter substrate-binding protein [Magnetococcales bacterium]
MVVAACLLASPGYGNEALVLRIHPYLGASKLIEKFTPLANHIATVLEKPVRIRISPDYKDHIRAIGQGDFDLAYLGPMLYVQTAEKRADLPILARLEVNGSPTFRGVIFARQKSSLEKLADLAGKKMAFGDPNSTMSHLVPRYMLLKAGVSEDRLAEYGHLSNHENVALGVLMGFFDGGAVKEGVFYKYRDRGLKALAWSPHISEHVIVANDHFPQGDIAALQKNLYQLHHSESGQAILHAIKPSVSALVPGEGSDFDPLREILHVLSEAGIWP